MHVQARLSVDNVQLEVRTVQHCNNSIHASAMRHLGCSAFVLLGAGQRSLWTVARLKVADKWVTQDSCKRQHVPWPAIRRLQALHEVYGIGAEDEGCPAQPSLHGNLYQEQNNATLCAAASKCSPHADQ